MFEIKNNRIHLTRGDTLSLSLEILDADGEVYTPDPETDTLVFTLKKNAQSDVILISKQFDLTGEVPELSLESSDTASLPFGKYKYEICLTTSDFVYTIFENKDFFLGEELG